MSAETVPTTVGLPVTECRRWRRFGHDRLYVNVRDPAAADLVKIGYRDLMTGVDHVDDPQHAGLLARLADVWESTSRPAGAVRALGEDAPRAISPAVGLYRPRPGRGATTRRSTTWLD